MSLLFQNLNIHKTFNFQCPTLLTEDCAELPRFYKIFQLSFPFDIPIPQYTWVSRMSRAFKVTIQYWQVRNSSEQELSWGILMGLWWRNLSGESGVRRKYPALPWSHIMWLSWQRCCGGWCVGRLQCLSPCDVFHLNQSTASPGWLGWLLAGLQGVKVVEPPGWVDAWNGSSGASIVRSTWAGQRWGWCSYWDSPSHKVSPHSSQSDNQSIFIFQTDLTINYS